MRAKPAGVVGQVALRQQFGLPDRGTTAVTFYYGAAEVWTTSGTITVVENGPGRYTFSVDCGENWTGEKIMLDGVRLDCVRNTPRMPLEEQSVYSGEYVSLTWPVTITYCGL